ncbi:hypothetical protein PCH70_13090 [Pseudomonas cichorii JBC1]|nr:hypothetical protein PCH70_13090 [Pseudomonas cichorii JBC1]
MLTPVKRLLQWPLTALSQSPWLAFDEFMELVLSGRGQTGLTIQALLSCMDVPI